MDVRSIIAEIDAEIAKLQGVKATLTGLSGAVAGVAKTGRRGRPKGSKNVAKAAKAVKVAKPAKKTKRKLSPEGRKRIADAMKRRWAERRKEAGK
jgi:hypothetical protein